MRGLAVLVAFALPCSACTSVLGEDFQSYVEEPLVCDPADPQGASPRQFVRCNASETCLLGQNADGTSDPTNTHASCFPSNGSRPPGSSCTYGNDCGTGAFCSPAFGCLAYCTLERTDCGDGARCLAFSPQATLAGNARGFCVPPCDPSDQSACAGTCSFLGADASTTGCVIHSGSGALGVACMQDQDCRVGLACDSAALRCTRYCRAGSTNCGSKTCLTEGEPALSYGGITYGYCSL